MSAISQYLARHAEPSVGNNTFPDTLSKHHYHHVLVIPAYQETAAQLESIWQSLSPGLIILVVNSPIASEPLTLALFSDMEKRWQQLYREGQYTFYKAQQHTVVALDYCTIPLTKGVGEARKIGSDLAMHLIEEGIIRSSWIHSTDADAILPNGYFEASEIVAPKNSFMLYPFRHTGMSLESSLYEFSILWYAFGTNTANSAYGYPSIGSAIACRAEAYAKVRGWPKRAAGEDFYFLNKLRKVGDYRYAACAPIQLSSRESDRVPFGTGPGIKKITAMPNPIHDYKFYHPGCFLALRNFLEQLRNCQHNFKLDQPFGNDLEHRFIIESGLANHILAKQGQTAAVFSKFIDDWFDGFRTLKFIHFMRDHQFPSVSFHELWQSDLLANHCPGEDPISIQSATQALWNRLLS
jgi:hypothetical protein